jgi:ABC-type nitrate/sulfonate/bicarbonate transport system permease component
VRVRLLEDALYPWVLISQAIPAAALAPLLTIWLGDGLAPRIAMAALFAFFPVLVAAAQGMRAVSREHLAQLRAWGATPGQVIRYLRLPAAMPALFAGLKLAAALAVVGVVVSELAGAGRGLGFVASVASYHLRTDRVFAAVALAAAISLGLHGLLTLAERIFVFWKRP